MRNVTLIESKSVSGGIDVVKNCDGGFNIVHNSHCEMQAYQIWKFSRGAGALLGFISAGASTMNSNGYTLWEFAFNTSTAAVLGAFSGHMLGYGLSALYESSCKGLS